MTSHPTPPGEDPLLERIRQLERRVAELETSDQLDSASFRSPGKVRYRDADGNSLFVLGRLNAGAIQSDGLLIERPDGVNALEFYDNGTGYVFVIKDEDNNPVLATDTDSNVGLARPYLPQPFTPALLVAEQATADTTWAALWRIDANVQHPGLRIHGYARSISGAAAEVRVFDNTAGVQLGPTVAVAVGTYFEFFIDGSWATPDDVWGAYHDVTVQARVTNATGTVGVELSSAYGVQS